MNQIRAGETYIIARDIGTAFRQGEQVVVEEVSPDAERPQFKYVVYSRTDQKRYRLADDDLQAAAPRPAAQPEVQVSQTVTPSSGEKNVVKIIGLVLLILLVVGAAIFATLYFVVWSDSGEQPVIETTPITTPQRTSPDTAPDTAPEPEPTYGTVKVSRAQYEQAVPGMTYEQVQAMFGGPGARQSESGTPGQPGYTVQYAWDGDQPGSAVFATFVDNALTEKSNTGL